MRVTLLTAGEYPAINSLHASQVLPFGSYLHQIGVNVQWVAFLPLETRLKDIVSGGNKLSKMNRLITEKGVIFHTIIFPITLTRIHSYIFRDRLVRRAGRQLARLLLKQADNTESHIVHCRSYFATAIALEAKKELKDIRISFDMRSLLPPEIPLMFPWVGNYLYGNLKRWESKLLKLSNFSFLPCQRGIRLLELEGTPRLPAYIPISGFEEIHDNPMLSNIVQNAVIGYVGGFGPWHSAALLQKVFDELALNLTNCSFEVLTSSTANFKETVHVRTVPNHKVKEIIKNMLAIVVPGPEYLSNHFSSIQLSANLFSTKAAEALSLGVPIVVNTEIKELAEYVRTHGCGLIFSMEKDKIQFEGIRSDQLSRVDLWNSLREAALRCAPKFRRSTIFEQYLKVWREN